MQKGAEALPEKEAEARPSYLRMLTETEENAPEPEKVEAHVDPTPTAASQGEPKVELEPKGEGPVPETPLLTPSGPPPSPSDPVISPMEQKAIAAMMEAIGNRKLDKAWTDNVPGNLKTTDPEAYKRLEKFYNDRLNTFRAK